ncbi:acyl-CoA desaturase [Gemmata sp. JC673]|uniref:Acyl-CoA desaturase n=1 Tax=Gemmata algarum TaxID=2975278 RepID=A0ABU5EZG2_9BACT|nr:acyl-CoA desaturase [Gemmata algarum]MDY3559890.1 acyl-CoA desaturase [Gemmata algarum]
MPNPSSSTRLAQPDQPAPGDVSPEVILPPPQQTFSQLRIVYSWLTTFVGVTVPLAGLVTGIVLAWGWGYFTWVDFSLLVGMYLASMLGISVGFHRLFTHRSFQTFGPIQAVFGVLGSMALQGPLLDWVGRHRLHHQHSDKDGDPHSPYPHDRGVLGWMKGFWHSHIGWAFAPMPDNLARYAGDWRKSRLIRTVSNLFPLWAVLGLVVPTAIGYAFGGEHGALTGFIWGGLVRILLGHHATWSVNSICHLWGTKPYASGDESRNNPLVGIAALGEGWHNNHHAFPLSARHGLKWWQFDMSWIIIWTMSRLGLAWKVRLPSRGELLARAETPLRATGAAS